MSYTIRYRDNKKPAMGMERNGITMPTHYGTRDDALGDARAVAEREQRAVVIAKDGKICDTIDPIAEQHRADAYDAEQSGL